MKRKMFAALLAASLLLSVRFFGSDISQGE